MVKLRYKVPINIWINSDNRDALFLKTEFKYKNLRIKVNFIGETPSMLDNGHYDYPYYRKVKAVRFNIIEDSENKYLEKFIHDKDSDSLLKLLKKISNRVFLAIRNYGNVTSIKLLGDNVENPKSVFGFWNLSYKYDKSEWQG
jgi:hypothetical protein